MTSRLYRTTRPLATQLTLVLRRLGIGEVGTPTTAVLIALYVSGLILLDGRQTHAHTWRSFCPTELTMRSTGCSEAYAPLHEGSDGGTDRLGQAPRGRCHTLLRGGRFAGGQRGWGCLRRLRV